VRLALLALVAARVAVGLCDLLVAAAMYFLFLMLQGRGAAAHLPGPPLTLLTLGIVTAALVIARALMDSSTAFFALNRIHKLQIDLLQRLVWGYTEMKWIRFAQRNRSELASFAIHTTRDAADFFHRLVEFAASIVIVTLMTAVVVRQNPLAACGFGVVLAAVYVLHRYGIRSPLQAAAARREDSLLRLQKDLADLLSSGREVRAYGLQSFFCERVGRHAQRRAAGDTTATLLPQMGRSAADQGAVLLFLVLIVIVQLHHGDVDRTLALLAFYFVLSRRLLPLISQIAFMAGEMESSWENVRIIDGELQECSLYRAPEALVCLPRSGYAVEFQGVCFSWRADAPILEDVDFHLRHGEVAILHGRSGIGKSSLLNLIAGISEPQRGMVRVDRRALAYVPQEVQLLDDSIRNNLLFGLRGRSDEELMQALYSARLAGFVSAQPRGLDANVGDNGALLSGGQRQRLGLARALVRRSSILLLDEATSALDESGEQQILETLSASGKTILLVTHRVCTRAFASRVLHLRDARLFDEYAHSECT
jgi:ABC-type multidrug transport system fused ATPase/permease subunit